MRKVNEGDGGVNSLLDAASFLTSFPVPFTSVHANPAQRLNQAFVWFPLVGALIGWIGAAVVSWAVGSWSTEVAALLGLITMVALTGGLHLDGFTDAVDGLAARVDRVKTLQIMRDSRIGAMGAMGLILLLGLKWFLIKAIPLYRLAAVLVAACGLSRWAMVISAKSFPYVSGETGLGRLATEVRSKGSLLAASLIGFAGAVVCLGPGLGFWSIILCAAVVWVVNSLFLKWLGGITGDTLGAVNEVVEISLLLLLTMR